MGRLSVIVPVFNADPYLRRCLDSLLCQGLGEQEMEIICVDDGSTDDSLSILQEYAVRNINIKVLSLDHAGVGAARNLGLQYATCEAVTFCDADDYLIPNGLSYVMTNFWNEDVDVICHGSTTLDEIKLKKWKENNDPSGDVIEAGSGLDVYLRSPKYFVWNTIIRRSFLETHNIYFLPLVMAEDACFLLDLMLAEPRTLDVSCNIYRYTVNEQQVTRLRNPQLMRKCINAYLCFFAKLKDNGMFKMIKLQMQPFYSRVLSADLNKKEWAAVKVVLGKLNIIAIPFILLQPIGFLYRRVFLPFILPHISRG